MPASTTLLQQLFCPFFLQSVASGEEFLVVVTLLPFLLIV